MAKVVYSKRSIKDLNEIGDYIAKILKNPMAAMDTVNKIQDSIDKLADFPLLGAALSSIFEINTDYRFLVRGNYFAFYRTQTNSVYIDRILHGRRDYLSILFHDLPPDDME